MIKPRLKIGIVLTIIVVLPSLFFSAYEIGNMTQNETVIDSIYSSQLESVLFSVNQYSDDVLNGWVNRLDKGKGSLESEIEKFIKKNKSVEALALNNSSGLNFVTKTQVSKDSLLQLKTSLTNKISANADKLEALQRYLKNDYQKVEVLDAETDQRTLLAFALEKKDSLPQHILLLVNSEEFIKETLGPKIQGIAQDRFYISVFKTSTGQEIYSNTIHEETEKDIRQKRKIWLFPAYELGIQMKGNTVEDLVRKRTNTNIVLLLVMDFVLLLGAWFVFKSIQQQIRLTQLKSDFISNVSHEIRTPLALINMYSETLEMGRLRSEEKKQEYYRVIYTETNRLSRMVNKILNFSKIESGKREYHFVELDVNNEIENIVKNYKQHLDKKGFKLQCKLASDLPPLNLDREAFAEAIINLIDNAVKYSDDVKKIEIQTGKDVNFVRIKIIDFGIGIAPKDQKMVFDKFFRVSSGNLARKAKGSGIGLSIVKHIAEAHDGKIEVESSFGKGSCFSLYFPLKTR